MRDCYANDFKFWRRELVALQKAFNAPRHKNIFQVLRDKRNIVQWYTFWIAAVVLILTIFFGVVQSVEGALQVYKAYHPS